LNNKKLGSKFEHEICRRLANKGYWVHFLSPDIRGAQPFDIIAARDGITVAIDCKTCAADYISISRLEQNQITAFEKWMRCGNRFPVIVVDHSSGIKCIEYVDLKAQKKVWIGGKTYERIQDSELDFSVSFDDYFDGI